MKLLGLLSGLGLALCISRAHGLGLGPWESNGAVRLDSQGEGEPISELDLDNKKDLKIHPEAMLGRWLQVYSNRLTDVLMMAEDARCSTMDMYMGPEGSMQLIESFQSNDTDASVLQAPATFTALMVPTNQALTKWDFMMPDLVSVPSRRQHKHHANFELLAAYPRNAAKQYDFLVFTDTNRLSLFVYARNLTEFTKKYDRHVRRWLEKTHGFDSRMTMPMHTNHSNCNYRPLLPPTVPEFDLPTYSGRYFQMYHNAFVEMFFRFDFDANCSTVDYIMPKDFNKSRYLSVIHHGTEIKNATIRHEASGRLEQLDSKVPGQMQLTKGYLPGSNFWVIKTGPVNETTKRYDYAIITDPLRLSLLVFAQDVQSFENYRAEVDQVLQEQGFTMWFNKPIRVDHTTCTYPEVPPHFQPEQMDPSVKTTFRHANLIW